MADEEPGAEKKKPSLVITIAIIAVLTLLAGGLARSAFFTG